MYALILLEHLISHSIVDLYGEEFTVRLFMYMSMF